MCIGVDREAKRGRSGLRNSCTKTQKGKGRGMVKEFWKKSKVVVAWRPGGGEGRLSQGPPTQGHGKCAYFRPEVLGQDDFVPSPHPVPSRLPRSQGHRECLETFFLVASGKWRVTGV